MDARYIVHRLVSGEPKRLVFTTTVTSFFYPASFDIVSVNEAAAGGTIIMPPIITINGRTLIVINETGTNTITVKDAEGNTLTTLSTRGAYVSMSASGGSLVVEGSSEAVVSGFTSITPSGTAVDGTNVFTNVIRVVDSAFTCVLTLPNTSGIVAVQNWDAGTALAVKIDGYAPQVSITAGKTSILALIKDWGLVEIAEEA